MSYKILRRVVVNRNQIMELLNNAKINNGGASDFAIIVPLLEIRSVLTILNHLKALGIISNYNRRNNPDNKHIDIFGYNK